MLLISGGPVFRPAPPPALGTITFIGQNYATGMAGSATVTPPAHMTGDLFLCQIWNVQTGTPPTMDAGVGLTEIEGDDHPFTGANLSLTAAWKYAESASAAFGSHTSAGNWRALVQVWRHSDPPVNPIGDVAFATTPGSNAVARYPGLTLQNPAIGSCIGTSLLSRTNTTIEDRTGIANAGGDSTGANSLRFGTSDGLVSSWAEQDRYAGANSETGGFAVEILRG